METIRDPIMTKPVLCHGLTAERVHLGKDGARVFYGSDRIVSPDETSNSVMVVSFKKSRTSSRAAKQHQGAE